jgi:hypothetical protein
MEAKDTILKLDAVAEIRHMAVEMPDRDMSEKWKRKQETNALLARQAEVSFAADVEQGKKGRVRSIDPWHWKGDGEDHLESLACPILIEADDLRQLVSDNKRVGMREVVEVAKKRKLFLNHAKGCLATEDADICNFGWCDACWWQAKLHEWGMLPK